MFEPNARTFLLEEMASAQDLRQFHLAYRAIQNYKQLSLAAAQPSMNPMPSVDPNLRQVDPIQSGLGDRFPWEDEA